MGGIFDSSTRLPKRIYHSGILILISFRILVWFCSPWANIPCFALFLAEEKHNRVTLRQTQVLVIPGNDELNQNFPVFDAVIAAINQARRGARDLVTDHSLEKIDEQLYGEVEDRDWV